METEILKFVCANQGAVNTDFLVFNLGLGDSTSISDIISNQEKFASCCPFGQPKVVARTKLRLCRNKECQGSCKGLHLCKNILFIGSCHFGQTRRGCSFSHDLHSDHNDRILRELELESLSRTELCTLLLQSDDRLLPPICYDYNNGEGEFGRCQDGQGCKRLHICEKFLNRDCSCNRTHDFSASQPLKSLKDKGVPDDFVRSLKSVYANIQALKYYDNRGNRGNKGNRQPPNSSTGEFPDAANSSDGSSSDGLISNQIQRKLWYRERGRGGHRGNRGNRGNRGTRGNRGNRGNQGNSQRLPRASSTSDVLASIDGLDLYTEDGLTEDNSDQDQPNPSTSDISAAADVSSDGQSIKQTPNLNNAAVRGRGGNRGNRGNHKQLPRTRSTNDILAAVNDDTNSDDGGNRRGCQRPVRDKTEICMYFIKGHCMHMERCFKAHDKMPYRWEIRQDDQWTAMPNNETIEKDYCDPKNTYSGSSPPVHFDTMTCGPNKVRRLSTLNSLLEPNFIHTTEWVWYWEDEFGKWNMYGAANVGHKPADMDSPKLEQKFLDNDKDVVEFIAGSQSYSLSFQDMIQTNKHYGTKRLVRRRPRYVSAADVQAKRVRRPPGQANFAAVPDHWDKTQIPQTGYKVL